jgi:4,5-dihydroxyphthalate decarboxylase
MWVRALLDEEFGVDAREIVWVATEPSHSEAYTDPPNVEHSEASLVDLLRSGSLAAAILGRQADKTLNPLIPTPAERDADWFERHGLVPINHMVVTTKEMVSSRPELVRAVYGALAADIDATRDLRSGGKLPSATDHGLERVRAGVALAAKYAAAQGLISQAPNIDALFVPPECLRSA